MAEYHYLTFSWILGGIIEAASGLSLKEVLDQRICTPLGLDADALHIGYLPDRLLHRTASLEVPRTLRTRRSGILGVFSRGVARAEALALTLVGNMRTWRSICLPSSNGYMTTDALARIYGALSNNGALRDSSPLVSARTMQTVVATASDKTLACRTRGIAQVLGSPPDAALALGFSPWCNPAISGGHDVLWHNGLGGCVGLGHTGKHYAVAVLKNSYQPASADGAGVASLPQDALDVISIVEAFVDSHA
jgi:CubicO group peptidase (beta-lactamase class C family)